MTARGAGQQGQDQQRTDAVSAAPPDAVSRSHSVRQSRWWMRMGREVLVTVALMVTFLLLLASFMQSGLAVPGQKDAGWLERLLHVVRTLHLDRHGAPIWPTFVVRCKATLPLAGAASLWLAGLSLMTGILLGLRPRWEPCRWIVLIVSSVPSFLWPLLAFVIVPTRPFSMFSDALAWGWPALCLAIGDLNWLTGTTLVADAVRRETKLPHWRLSLALGCAVSDLVPRLAVTCTALLASRLPHLIGGTIVLEALFQIDGLGLWSWNAIVESPPDPAVLIWVGGLGIVLSRLTHAATVVVATAAFPDQQETAVIAEAGESGSVTPTSDLTPERAEPHTTSPSETASRSDTGEEVSEIHLAADIELHAHGEVEPVQTTRAGWFQTIRLRWRHYHQSCPEGRSRVRIGYVVLALWILLMAMLWGHDRNVQAQAARGKLRMDRNVAMTEMFEPVSASAPFGGNAASVDVAHLLWHGWWQQLPAWGLCVLALTSAVPVALAAVITAVCQGHWYAVFGRLLTAVADWLTFLFEATPKMIWLLACFSIFPVEGRDTRMIVAIGVLFVPQLYRAQRNELASLRNSVFLEAMRLARIPWWRVFRDNVLAGHVWPLLCVQIPLILSNVVLTEAWMGYVGARNRSESFTWGSVLGTGVTEFTAFRPLAENGYPFNDGIVWGPLVCLCLTICALNTLGHYLKVITDARAGH